MIHTHSSILLFPFWMNLGQFCDFRDLCLFLIRRMIQEEAFMAVYYIFIAVDIGCSLHPSRDQDRKYTKPE
jgi:hypothetical protein